MRWLCVVPFIVLSAPALAQQAAGEQEIEKVGYDVTSITPGRDGKSRFTLENGQVWKQVDSTRLRNPGDGPWTAEIGKATFGSFLLKIGNSAAVRVERLN